MFSRLLVPEKVAGLDASSVDQKGSKFKSLFDGAVGISTLFTFSDSGCWLQAQREIVAFCAFDVQAFNTCTDSSRSRNYMVVIFAGIVPALRNVVFLQIQRAFKSIDFVNGSSKSGVRRYARRNTGRVICKLSNPLTAGRYFRDCRPLAASWKVLESGWWRRRRRRRRLVCQIDRGSTRL